MGNLVLLSPHRNPPLTDLESLLLLWVAVSTLIGPVIGQMFYRRNHDDD